MSNFLEQFGKQIIDEMVKSLTGPACGAVAVCLHHAKMRKEATIHHHRIQSALGK